jgi:hypothetical protein
MLEVRAVWIFGWYEWIALNGTHQLVVLFVNRDNSLDKNMNGLKRNVAISVFFTKHFVLWYLISISSEKTQHRAICLQETVQYCNG